MATPRRDPRPKPAGETLQFMQRLWETVHALDVRSKWMERNIGITGPQRLVVRIVGQSPSITATEIASTLGMHPSTLTGILSRLEERALIARDVDPEDRRRARFRLTAGGKRIDRERKGTVEAAVRRALTRAGDDAVKETEKFLALLVAELHRDE